MFHHHKTPCLPRPTPPQLAIAALAGALTACPETEQDPCELDAFGCLEPNGPMPTDVDCADNSPLDLELGWGDTTFTALTTPITVYDGIQGGQHVFLAVRIKNAELESYDQLEVELTLYQGMTLEACEAALANAREFDLDSMPEALRDPNVGAEPGSPAFIVYGEQRDDVPLVGDSRCLEQASSRLFGLGQLEPLTVTPEGWVEQVGLFMVLPWSSAQPTMAVADARDPCRRTGQATTILDR